VPSEAVTEKLPVLEIDRTEVFAHFQISLISDGKTSPAWVVLLNSDTYFEAHILDQEPSVRNNPIDTNLEDLSHTALRVDQNSIPSQFSQLKIGNRFFTIVGSLPAVVMNIHDDPYPIVKERVGVNSTKKSESQTTVLFTTKNKPRTKNNIVEIDHSQRRFQLSVPDTLASIASLQFPSQDSNGKTSFFMPVCNKGEIEALVLIESRHIVSPTEDQLEVPLYVLEDIFRKLTGYQDPQPEPQDVDEVDEDHGQDKRSDKSTEARKLSIWQRVQGIFDAPVNIDHYNLSPDVNDASQQPEPKPSLPVQQEMGWKKLANLSDRYLQVNYPDEASAYGKKHPKEIKIPEKRESDQPFVLESQFDLPGRMCDLYLSGVDARNVSLRLGYRDVASRPSLKLRHTTIGAIRPEANVTLENALKAELTTAGSSHYVTVGKQAAKEQLLQSFPLAWSSVETEIIITLPTRFQRISDEYYNQQMSLTLKGAFEDLTQQSTDPPLNLRELHLNPTNTKAAITLNNWGRVWCQNPDQIKSLSTTGCHFVVIEGGAIDLTAISYGTVISKGIVGKASVIGKNAADSCYTSAGILESLDATNSTVDIFILSPVGPEDLVLSNCQGVVQLVSSDMDPSSRWYTDLNYEIETVESGDIQYARHRKEGLMKISTTIKPKSNSRRVDELVAALDR
jgi:hypothetical protein